MQTRSKRKRRNPIPRRFPLPGNSGCIFLGQARQSLATASGPHRETVSVRKEGEREAADGGDALPPWKEEPISVKYHRSQVSPSRTTRGQNGIDCPSLTGLCCFFVFFFLRAEEREEGMSRGGEAGHSGSPAVWRGGEARPARPTRATAGSEVSLTRDPTYPRALKR